MSTIVNETSLRAAAERMKIAPAAAGEPLPGPMLEAATANGEDVAGFHVRETTAFDMAIFKLLNSPVYRQMIEFAEKGYEKAGDVRPTDEEAWDLCYVLTRPSKQVGEALRDVRLATYKVRAELAKPEPSLEALENLNAAVILAKAAFSEKAAETIAMNANQGQVWLIVAACLRSVNRQLLAAQSFAASAEEGGGETHCFPVSAPAQATG